MPLTKRSWASEEPGVILDFVVVFLVLCGILALIIQKAWRHRQAERAEWEVEEIRDVEKGS
ncbi:uncharacterized protein BO80DRAFT_422932 [Aspergillus ibericus CBS 121593]|uniref:Uncharacterized protein n=1 Tax=Aspergillus ibericus CBS 121593 TaxID=1448316 RepID=A0A395H772_9EURO|nr:hypothetical protein BO80DRAFT_422932 [Aspergillus ibericus CBS 121593]RAL03476.1 hypothetical protein BO80DRAFT_422932 [Aspergillus ibericus CBS 121593]